MDYHKIVLAGGNGYLGSVLAGYYKSRAEEVIILSRKPKVAEDNVKTIVWDGKTKSDWVGCLEYADLLINLCGKNVNCRYTPENRKEILDSRIIPTTLLGRVIGAMAHPPKLWMNVTSATIYRHAEDRPQDEESGETGTGFSVNICKQWERTFFETHTPATRKVALRMGIVLGKNDGVFPRLLNLVKFGLGGQQGNGKQYVAWIHEQDAAHITEWILKHPEYKGVYNCTAPMPVPNEELMRTIRHAYGAPIGLPSPQWLLELGALLIGTETELVLKSRWVVPARLIEAGYRFQFPSVDLAILNCLK